MGLSAGCSRTIGALLALGLIACGGSIQPVLDSAEAGPALDSAVPEASAIDAVGSPDSGIVVHDSGVQQMDSAISTDSTAPKDVAAPDTALADSTVADSSIADAPGMPCQISPATYKVVNTLAPGGTPGPGCPPPDSVVTWPEPDSGAMDANAPDSGILCTGTADLSTCTYTTGCSGTVAGGYVDDVHFTETITGGSPSGNISYSLMGPDGGVVSSCSYDYAWIP